MNKIEAVSCNQFSDGYAVVYIHRANSMHDYRTTSRMAIRYARFLSIVLAYAARIEKAQEVK